MCTLRHPTKTLWHASAWPPASSPYFLSRAPFPAGREGPASDCHFRGLLRLHSCYGPPIAQSPRLPLLRGSSPASYRPSRSSATRSIDNSLGGISSTDICAFGAYGPILVIGGRPALPTVPITSVSLCCKNAFILPSHITLDDLRPFLRFIGDKLARFNRVIATGWTPRLTRRALVLGS